MNILPKKSWHVRTRANIEKVRRDEQKHAEEEAAKEARRALAEQEARTDYLRRRAKQLQGRSTGEDEDGLPSSSRLPEIALSDLFSDVREGKGDRRPNAERQAEEKAEQERWEKQIGLLQCLGDSAQKPWYLDSHDVRMKLNEEAKKEDTPKKTPTIEYGGTAKGVASTHYQYDPLNTMNIYLDQMRQTQKAKATAKASSNQPTLLQRHQKFDRERDSSERRSKKSKEEHKSRHHRKHRHRKDQSAGSSSDEEQIRRQKMSRTKDQTESEPGSSAQTDKISQSRAASASTASPSPANREKDLKMEKLRAERLARERHECDRAEALIRSRRPDTRDSIAPDDRLRSYHNQFNPHLIRR